MKRLLIVSACGFFAAGLPVRGAEAEVSAEPTPTPENASAAQSPESPSPETAPDAGAEPALPAPDPNEDLPPVARAAILEGNAAFADGNYTDARDAYRHVRAAAPDNLLALVNLGLAEYYLGNADEAERLLREAVQQRLETAPAWFVLGMIHMDHDRLEEAMAALAQANVYDPANPRARNFMGVVVGRMGWYDAAESELRKALELDPRYADAHFNLAYFYLQRRHPAVELARRHYQQALDLGAESDPELEKLLKEAASQNP